MRRLEVESLDQRLKQKTLKKLISTVAQLKKKYFVLALNIVKEKEDDRFLLKGMEIYFKPSPNRVVVINQSVK